MAFTTQNMDVFSKRVQNYMLALQNLREEGERLYHIYVNEAQSGDDPEFTDTPIATKQEHIDAMTMMVDVKKFVENQDVITTDRQQWITPFIQMP